MCDSAGLKSNRWRIYDINQMELYGRIAFKSGWIAILWNVYLMLSRQILYITIDRNVHKTNFVYNRDGCKRAL